MVRLKEIGTIVLFENIVVSIPKVVRLKAKRNCYFTNIYTSFNSKSGSIKSFGIFKNILYIYIVSIPKVVRLKENVLTAPFYANNVSIPKVVRLKVEYERPYDYDTYVSIPKVVRLKVNNSGIVPNATGTFQFQKWFD